MSQRQQNNIFISTNIIGKHTNYACLDYTVWHQRILSHTLNIQPNLRFFSVPQVKTSHASWCKTIAYIFKIILRYLFIYGIIDPFFFFSSHNNFLFSDYFKNLKHKSILSMPYSLAYTQKYLKVKIHCNAFHNFHSSCVNK